MQPPSQKAVPPPPPPSRRRKLLFPLEPHQRVPAGLLLLAFLGASGVLESFVTIGPVSGFEQQATGYLDASGKKAVEAFAAARAINATVSVLKSTDLSAVIAQVAPMEVLEPVDDLAKQFSDVMVVSIVSIFLQGLLLQISQTWSLGGLLPIACTLLAASYHSQLSPSLVTKFAAIGRGILVVALFSRFAVPMAGVVGANITDSYLANNLTESLTQMQSSGASLSQITAQVAPAPSAEAETGQSQNTDGAANLIDQVKNALRSKLETGTAYVNAARNWLPDKATIEALVVNLPGHIVRAIEIFLVQTIVTPLGVAYLFYVLLRQVIRPAALDAPKRNEDRPLAFGNGVPVAAE